MTTKNFKVKNGIDIGDNISISETGIATNITAQKGIEVDRTITGGGRAVDSNGDVAVLRSSTHPTPLPVSAFFDNTTPDRRGNIVVREYGENTGDSTDSTTMGQAILNIESSRGTGALPLAPNFGTTSTTTGGLGIGSYDGMRWSTENSVGSQIAIVGQTTETWSAQGQVFTGSIATNVLTVSAVTSFTSTGSTISGTTLTIGTLTSGTIAVGQTITGGTTATGTIITGNISGSGSGSTWTVNTSQTVASSSISSTGIIGPGMVLTGTGIPQGTTILSFGNDTNGGVGTYNLNTSLASPVSSTTITGLGTNSAGLRTIITQTPTGVKYTTASRQTHSVYSNTTPGTTTINGVSVPTAPGVTISLGINDAPSTDLTLVGSTGAIYKGRGASSLQLQGGSILHHGVTPEDGASFTGYIATNTLTVTAVSSGTISPGQLVFATGIQPATFITAQLTNQLNATTTASGTNGTATITVASATGISAGQLVVATGVPANTFVSSISDTTITLTANLTAGLTNTAIEFYTIGKQGTYTVSTTFATAGQTVGSIGTPVAMASTPDNVSNRATNVFNGYAHRKNTTPGRRAALKSGDTLYQFNFNGQAGAGVANTGLGTTSARMRFTAAEDFTTTRTGSKFELTTANIGTNTPTTRLALASDLARISSNQLNIETGLGGNNGTVMINPAVIGSASFNERIGQIRVSTPATQVGDASTITFNTGKWTGSAASGNYTATQNQDKLGEFFFAGNYGTSNQFTTSGPSIRFQALAAENFTSNASGGRFTISGNKIGTNNSQEFFGISTANGRVSTDVFTITDADYNDSLSVDTNGNVIVSRGNLTLTSGTISGNGSGLTNLPNRFNQELNTTNNVTFANITGTGDLSLTNGSANLLGSWNSNQPLSITATLLDTNYQAGGTIGFETKYKASQGASTFTVPQTNWSIGKFAFSGSSTTAGTSDVLAGQMLLQASENWSSTNHGTKFLFTANRDGQTWQNGSLVVMALKPESVDFRSDELKIQSATGTNYATFSNDKIFNNRPHRSALTTATMARGNTYTPAATANNYIELTLTAGTDPTYIDVDNLTVANEGGHVAILVYNNSGSGVGNGDLIVRNNGTQINDTHDTIANGGRVIITIYCVGNYASCEYMTAA